MENRPAGLGKGVWAVFQFEVTTTSMTRTNQEKEQVVAKFFIAKIDRKSTKNRPEIAPRALESAYGRSGASKDVPNATKNEQGAPQTCPKCSQNGVQDKPGSIF